MVELRCKSCGAPIDVTGLDADAPFVTCQWRWTHQARLGSRLKTAASVTAI